MTLSRTRALLSVCAFLIAAVALCQAPGDLVVTPTRVLLDDKVHTGDITLVNRGSQTVRYRLSLVDMEMGKDGVLHRVPTNENSASSILRLSPREVVLEPGVSQRIKIAATFPQGGPERELRSHLAFEPLTPGKSESPQSGTGSALSLTLELRSVVTIPVIAQHGRLNATAALSQASVEKSESGWVAKFKLTRDGNRTIRGDLVVSFAPAGGGAKITLGQVSGLPVYFPNADRTVTVRLTRDISSLGKGEIEISFAEPERSKGAATARTAVELPK